MATDVSQSTLETVFRISIGKLRVLHNLSQSSVITPVFRVSQTNGSNNTSSTSVSPQRSATLLRPTHANVSTANRLLRSLLITRIARKARSQLLLQQCATPSHRENNCSSTDSSSDPPLTTQSSSQFTESPTSQSPSLLVEESAHSQTEPNRKRHSAPSFDIVDHIPTKQRCERSEEIQSISDSTNLTQPNGIVDAAKDITEADVHSVARSSGPTSHSRDNFFQEMPSTSRLQESFPSQKHGMNPRLAAVVMTAAGAEQSSVCHVQPSSAVSHLNTVPYRLLPGVS
ncbi:hypothetical protein FBUS_06238 [Fasciolopsis buskii]|uniref:Uncharacterized protein n=1 Tax=Fasciolopsis buskii TaxID=27845 RepID=A0A8E0S6A1_9TREM|nr:hypothetical protein FBUS_06238 [Fasciolopsis buski]